ncbi:MAG TPA: Gfo/Idh/MocA family oxidoreductase [Firmicutes bacterium]|nr:Gfo/Idh/MocA family oxidoreductase [Bacillota bacterium]
MSLKVGIIGAGNMGRLHTQILRSLDGVRVVGVVDKDENVAQRFSQETGVGVFGCVDALLEQVEAVFITTPNTAHVESTIKALAQDIHVFCEKPMATSLDEASKVLKAARSSDAIYQIGYNRRNAPVYRKAKQLISEGRVRPRFAQVKMNRGELCRPSWVGDRAITGGFLYESVSHLLDIARWLVGDIASVRAFGRTGVYEEPDEIAIVLTAQDGTLISFSACAHSTWMFPFERVEIYGDHSTIVTEEMERVGYCLGIDEEAVYHTFTHLPREEKWGYVNEDRLFIEAIRGERQPSPGVDDAYKATELVEACYLALERGDVVKLPL